MAGTVLRGETEEMALRERTDGKALPEGRARRQEMAGTVLQGETGEMALPGGMEGTVRPVGRDEMAASGVSSARQVVRNRGTESRRSCPDWPPL
jgi:hypothetical protein